MIMTTTIESVVSIRIKIRKEMSRNSEENQKIDHNLNYQFK